MCNSDTVLLRQIMHDVACQHNPLNDDCSKPRRKIFFMFTPSPKRKNLNKQYTPHGKLSRLFEESSIIRGDSERRIKNTFF